MMHPCQLCIFSLICLILPQLAHGRNFYRLISRDKVSGWECMNIMDPRGMEFTVQGQDRLHIFYLHRYTGKGKSKNRLVDPDACDTNDIFPIVRIYNKKMNQPLQFHLQDSKKNTAYATSNVCENSVSDYVFDLELEREWMLPRCPTVFYKPDGVKSTNLTVEVSHQYEHTLGCPVYFCYFGDKFVELGSCKADAREPEPVLYPADPNSNDTSLLTQLPPGFNDIALEVASESNLHVNVTHFPKEHGDLKYRYIDSPYIKNYGGSILLEDTEQLFFYVENLKANCPLMYRIKHEKECNDWKIGLTFFQNRKCIVNITKTTEQIEFRAGTDKKEYATRNAKPEFEFFIDNGRFTVLPTGIYHALFLSFCNEDSDNKQLFTIFMDISVASDKCADNLRFEIVDNAIIRAPSRPPIVINNIVTSTEEYDDAPSEEEVDTAEEEPVQQARLPIYVYAIIAVCFTLLIMIVAFILYNAIPAYCRRRKAAAAKQDLPKIEIKPNTEKEKPQESLQPTQKTETKSSVKTPGTPGATDRSSQLEVAKQGTVEAVQKKLPQQTTKKVIRKPKAQTPSRRVLSAEDIRDVVDSPMAILPPPTPTVKRLKHVHYIGNYTYPPTMVNYNTVKQPLFHVSNLFQLLPFLSDVEVPIEDHVYFRYRDLTTENNSAFRHFRTRLLEPSFNDEAPIIGGTTLLPVTVRAYVLDHDPPAFELHFPNNVPPEFLHKLTGCRPCQQYTSLQTLPTYYSSSQYNEAVGHLKQLAPGAHTYINVDTLPEDANKEEISSVYAFRSLPYQDRPKTPRHSPLQTSDHRHMVKLRALDDAEFTAHGIVLTKFIVTPVKISAFDTSHMSTTGVASSTPASSYPDSTTQLDSTNASDFSTKSNKSNSRSTKGTKQLS